jgi:hypothetical protein
MFEKRCVVCLDILGFKNLITEAERSPAGLLKLQGLRVTLDAHITWDNHGIAASVPATHVPKYLFISDTVIISTPADAMGAGAAIVKSIQIYQKVVEAGHLLRGAIVSGNAWHDDRNIFGTGWIEAFNAQEKEAIHPRITVSTEIVDLLEPNLRSAMLISDADGKWICDVLHPAYIREAALQGGIELFYKQVVAQIAANSQLLKAGSSAHDKWQWMGEFMRRALPRYGYNADQL